MSILSVDTIQPIGSGSTVTLNAAKTVVGTGITFESNGQAIYAGIITATSFSGSGANLTSLPAANITGTLPAISGANLTGITTTTINNNGSNRIITGSGTANTLEGEATFIYDGTSVATIDTSQTYATFRLDGSAGGAIEFYENGTRRFELYGTDPEVALYDRDKGAYHTRFKAGGNVELSDGNLVLASGHGIDFSSYDPTSYGSISSEILDDYEEGSWTPTEVSGLSLTVYVATYIKIGRLVHVECGFLIPTNSDGGGLQFGGLPYQAQNSGDNSGGLHLTSTNSGRSDHFYAIRNQTNIGVANNNNQNVARSAYSNKQLKFSGTYMSTF